LTAQPTSYWKLGLFVLGGIAVGLAAIAWLGASWLDRRAVHAVAYFDESVSGLNEGSPVKIRGVTVGSVTDISLAPDRRRVAVYMDAYEDKLESLGLPVREDEHRAADTVRVKLALTGISGQKHILVELYEEGMAPPVEPLGFEPPENLLYLESMRSSMKSIESAGVGVVERLPEITRQIEGVLAEIQRILEGVDPEAVRRLTGELRQSADAMLVSIKELSETLDRKLEDLDTARLDTRLAEVLDSVRALSDELRGAVHRLAAEDGEIPRTARSAGRTLETLDAAVRGLELPATGRSLREAATAISGAAEEFAALNGDLRVDLAALQETLEAIRRLADLLEREPDALLRGKSDNEGPNRDS
jgi:paraquat-inducible protein B